MTGPAERDARYPAQHLCAKPLGKAEPPEGNA